jgi:Flp pilus assembly protein TadB
MFMLAGLALVMLLLGAFSGPNAKKESTRRLQQVRFRHSDSAVDKVEAQYRKAIASRTPRAYRVAGSASRTEALALRLHRTGKGWTLSQYLYASLGLGLTVAALIFLKTGALLLAVPAGLLVGAGFPTSWSTAPSPSAPTPLSPAFPMRWNCWCAGCAPACRSPRRWALSPASCPARWARNSSW